MSFRSWSDEPKQGGHNPRFASTVAGEWASLRTDLGALDVHSGRVAAIFATQERKSPQHQTTWPCAVPRLRPARVPRCRPLEPPAAANQQPRHGRSGNSAAMRGATLLRRLLLPFVLAAAVLVGFAIYSGWGGLSAALRTFNPWLLIPVLLLALANYAVRFARWEYYLHVAGLRLPLRDSLGVFGSGLAMAITPGKFGELFKSALLKDEDGIAVSASAPVVLAERLSDLAGVVLLLAFASVWFPQGRLFAVAAAVLVVVIVVFAWRSPRLARRVLDRLLRRRWPAWRDTASRAHESFFMLVRGRALVVGIVLGVLAWGAECLAFFIVLRGLPSAAQTLLAATFVYTLATLGGAISLLPGGLGVTEGSMAGLLVALHVSRDSASAAVLVIRACTLWFAVALGILAYLVHRRHRRRALAGAPRGSSPGQSSATKRGEAPA
jgi:uncharacterized membrane protein YbhN (UPF0104 family)